MNHRRDDDGQRALRGDKLEKKERNANALRPIDDREGVSREGWPRIVSRVTAHLLDHDFTKCTSTHITKCKSFICILILLLSAIYVP